MVPLIDIFDVWYGVNLEVVNSEVVSAGIPFVSRQSVNNGVVCHVKKMDDVEPNPSHTLSIAVSGSVLSTFYHDYEYYSGRDIYVAKPKIKLTKIGVAIETAAGTSINLTDSPVQIEIQEE